jgi:peptidoglycan/LPS O-acetylase OafA/YrhL
MSNFGSERKTGRDAVGGEAEADEHHYEHSGPNGYARQDDLQHREEEDLDAREGRSLMHDIELSDDTFENDVSWRQRLRASGLKGFIYITWARFLRTVYSLGFFGTVRTLFNYPEPGTKLRSTAWLDGLRGLAAFEVFIFHYDDGWIDRSLGWGNIKFTDPAWYRAPFIRTFYASGDGAVCLFFAISGFALSYKVLTLIRTQQHDKILASLSSSVFRRGIRLYMPVAIETFILMILCRMGLPKPVGYDSAPTLLLEIQNWALSFARLLMPLRYPDRWDKIIDKYDGGISWTIPLEYWGSLVVYVTLLMFSRTRSRHVRLAISTLIILTAFHKDDWIAAVFLLGMSYADYKIDYEANLKLEASHAQSLPTLGETKRKPWRPALGRWRTTFFFGVFLFGFYLAGLPGGRMVHNPDDPYDYHIESRPSFDWITQPIAYFGWYFQRQMDRYILSFAGLAILMGTGESPVRRVMETRFVQYLGRISFGLYLCHIFLHAWLKPLDWYYKTWVGLDPTLMAAQLPREAHSQLFAAYVMSMIPATIVNFIVGGLFERFLDRPSVNAGRYFEEVCLSLGKSPRPEEDEFAAGAHVAGQETGVIRLEDLPRERNAP